MPGRDAHGQGRRTPGGWSARPTPAPTVQKSDECGTGLVPFIVPSCDYPCTSQI